MVSDKHANFIQADAGGSADDVRRVIEAVKGQVSDRLGIELAVELRLVGGPEPVRCGSLRRGSLRRRPVRRGAAAARAAAARAPEA